MINAHIDTILVATGLATALTIVLCVAPRPALKFAFGFETQQPIVLLIASHWGLLIFLIGALLVYAAFEPTVRVPSMVVATVEKLFFAGLVFFGYGPKTVQLKAFAVVDTAIGVSYLNVFRRGVKKTTQ